MLLMSNAERPTLVPGTYRLTQDVKNPTPKRNRSSRREWGDAAVVPAGSVFALDLHPLGRGWDDAVFFLRMHDHSDKALQDSELFQALVEHLEPVEESPSDLLTRKGWEYMGGGILDQLCRQGLVTTAQVEAAARAFLEECRRLEREKK